MASATKTTRWQIVLSEAQAAALAAWGDGKGPTDIVRALAREVLNDFPPDPPPPGGNREGRRPAPGDEIRLKRDVIAGASDYSTRTIRAGTVGVVEDRNRGGLAVRFGSDVVFVRYRDAEIVEGN